MDIHDINGARAVITHLCREGLKWHRNTNLAKPWLETFESVGQRFSTNLGEEEVERILLKKNNADNDIAGEIEGPYILLAPPSRNQSVVCFLGIRWNLTDDETEMSLYLHMFGPSQISGIKTWHRGYRFEMPHRAGSHTYTHVQPVKATGWTKRALVEFSDQGVPDSFPAFPLPSRTLTTLCAALAVALHGRQTMVTLLRLLRGHRARTDLSSLLN